MQKTITRISLLVILTLTLTQLAKAVWNDYEFTNESSKDAYVAFSTLRPADAQRNIPAGWRTVGWYRIRAGESHTFYAQDENPIYYIIYHNGRFISPDNVQKFNILKHNKAFVLVNEFPTDALLSNIKYSSRNIDTFTRDTGFKVEYSSQKDSRKISITSQGKVIGGGQEDLPGGEQEDLPINRLGSLTISGDTNINQGETGTITVTVRSADGEALSGVTVRFSKNNDHISLSRTSGTTDNSGKVSTTITAVSQGGTVLSVAVDGSPGLTKHAAITVAEAPPGSLTIASFSSSINEGDSRTITATVKSKAGNPLPGKTVRFQENSSAISFSSTSGTTNSSGQVSTTLRTSYVSSRSSATFYVRIDGYAGLDRSSSVTINPVAHTLSITSLPGSMTSGHSKTVTATVRSKGNYVMSGATVQFSESSSYLRFSSTRVTTNSSGKASSTLRTGGHGGDSKFYITVSVAGTSLRKQDWTRVQGVKTSFDTTVTFESKKDCDNNDINGEYDWRKTVNLPGPVTSWRYRYWIPDDDKCCVKVTGSHNRNGVQLSVYGRSFPHCKNPNTVRIRFYGSYLKVASPPGAPSLHRQLRSDPDQLSIFWEDMSQVPSETVLLTNYPNPFNPETWIPYHLSEPVEVTLSIYSADGRLVRTLALGNQAAGVYESKSRAAYWDGRNAVGERVASGLYFYTLTAGDFVATQKMLIMK